MINNRTKTEHLQCDSCQPFLVSVTFTPCPGSSFLFINGEGLGEDSGEGTSLSTANPGERRGEPGMDFTRMILRGVL